MEKIIDSILQKEKEAELLIENANKKAFDIIQESKITSEKIIQEYRKKAGVKGEELIDAALKQGRQKAEELLKESDKDILDIKEKSKKHLEPALNFIFRKIK